MGFASILLGWTWTQKFSENIFSTVKTKYFALCSVLLGSPEGHKLRGRRVLEWGNTACCFFSNTSSSYYTMSYIDSWHTHFSFLSFLSTFIFNLLFICYFKQQSLLKNSEAMASSLLLRRRVSPLGVVSRSLHGSTSTPLFHFLSWNFQFLCLFVFFFIDVLVISWRCGKIWRKSKFWVFLF